MLKITNHTFQFQSRLSVFFYLGVAFIVLILSLTVYNLVREDLTIAGFLFLNAITLAISYAFELRFSCSIALRSKTLRITYLFKDEKHLYISTEDIVAIEKHADSAHRFFKKLLIITPKETFLIRYNISESSEEDLLKILNIIGRENKPRLT